MVNIVNILWTKSIIQYRKWKKEGGEGEVYMLIQGDNRNNSQGYYRKQWGDAAWSR